MSNGGGESGRDNHEQSKTKSRTDDFARAIAKIAVAQVCESVGFPIFQQSALNTLSDVAVRYICEIGKTAHNYSNLAGRTESNVFDIIQGLEDLGSWQGFLGASDIDRCLASSGVVQEVIQYVGESEEIPFAYSIPEFPVVKDRNPSPSFAQVGETLPDDHIPPWLPVFPDPQAYLTSPSSNVRELETLMVEFKHDKEQRMVERSFLNLQQHFSCNGSEVPTAFDPFDAAKAKQAAESNQFLAAPLRFGEKEVSSMELLPQILNGSAARSEELVQNRVVMLETSTPAIEAVKSTLRDSEVGCAEAQTAARSDELLQNHVFMLETSSPAIEAVKGTLHDSEVGCVEAQTAARSDELVQNHVSMLETSTPTIEGTKNPVCDSEGGWVEVQNEQGREEVPMNTRATIQFKFGTRKKPLGPSINSCFGDDNEKSDKKRRAEQILKESTIDMHELAQL